MNEQHLQTALAIWTAAFEHLPDGIVICDPSDNLLLINPVMREMIDLNADAPLPQHFSDLPLEPYDASYDLPKHHNRAQHYTVGERILRCTRSPATSDDGRVLGSVLVLCDVTAEVNEKRTAVDFVTTMIHELRAPLTPIFGNVDLLLHGLVGSLSWEQKEILQQIRLRAGDVNAVVVNMIQATSIVRNTFVCDPEPLSLYDIVYVVMQSQKSDFAAKNLELHNDIHIDLPQIFADRELVRIILFQLLNNACRFTQQGSVTLRAQEDGAMIRVDIIDTGIGIPQESQIDLFEPFFHVLHPGSGDGTGLGLYIVRHLVEHQGGRVWAESTPGQGSTFSFTVPQAVPSKQV